MFPADLHSRLRSYLFDQQRWNSAPQLFWLHSYLCPHLWRRTTKFGVIWGGRVSGVNHAPSEVVGFQCIHVFGTPPATTNAHTLWPRTTEVGILTYMRKGVFSGVSNSVAYWTNASRGLSAIVAILFSFSCIEATSDSPKCTFPSV